MRLRIRQPSSGAKFSFEFFRSAVRMALGSAQDENRTNKIASWPDGFTMRAVFDVKKRKSVLKLIVALSLPLFVWLSASAQTTSAEKPSITEKIGLPGHPLANYKPVTGPERFKWFVKSTVGPSSLFLYGPLSAALGTCLIRGPDHF